MLACQNLGFPDVVLGLWAVRLPTKANLNLVSPNYWEKRKSHFSSFLSFPPCTFILMHRLELFTFRQKVSRHPQYSYFTIVKMVVSTALYPPSILPLTKVHIFS